MKPYFVISLDFELIWGVIDSQNLDHYKEFVLGVREAIPELLRLFKKYEIHVTWATVGLTTFENKKEILEYLPKIFPDYFNMKLNPYHYLKTIGSCEKSDPYHYGFSLFNQVLNAEGMEIASHSFSHYYCLEPKKNRDSFWYDTEASIENFKRFNITPKSFVFCKNQYDQYALDVIKEFNFINYRGTANHLLYNSRNTEQENIVIKTLRYFDSYIQISGNNESSINKNVNGLIDINASRFLRPVAKNNKLFAHLQQKRIIDSMNFAASNNLGYHLWWHPFNFGKSIKENIFYLENILKNFKKLEEKYNMSSLTMYEVSNLNNL